MYWMQSLSDTCFGSIIRIRNACCHTCFLKIAALNRPQKICGSHHAITPLRCPSISLTLHYNAHCRIGHVLMPPHGAPHVSPLICLGGVLIWDDHLISERSARLVIPHIVKRRYGLLNMWLDIPAWALIEKPS